MNKAQPLRPTHVVTCLLERQEAIGTKLLLLRRSERVGSYQGRWAGVSGFVEEGVTPEQQAYTEIREEVGLAQDQVRLLRRGAVVEYSDVEIGRHWFIHPFLFLVDRPENIQTDWEAVEAHWIDPGDLPNYPTVPKLLEVYQSACAGETIS